MVIVTVTVTVVVTVTVTVTCARIVSTCHRHRHQRRHPEHQSLPVNDGREEGAQQRQGPPIQTLVYSHERLQQQLHETVRSVVVVVAILCCCCCCCRFSQFILCVVVVFLFSQVNFGPALLTFLVVSCCWASATPLNIVET